jgi:outer membrane autotransporter protein
MESGERARQREGERLSGGLYGSFFIDDQLYLAGVATFGSYDTTTDRTVNYMGTNVYHAKFSASAEAVHLELGENFDADIGAIAPYLRGGFQELHTPSYGESTVTGSPQFALNYTRQSHIDLTSEIGATYDSASRENKDQFDLRVRLGWLHDFAAGVKDTATFDQFDGAAFTVHGAAPPHDAAHAVIGIEEDLDAIALTLDAQGVLGPKSQSYGGSAGFAYRW